MALVAPAGAARQEAPTDAGAPSGDGVQPALVQGNPTCADAFGDIQGIVELKLEGDADYDDVSDGVDITRYSDNTFDFEFDDGVVYGVVVKGGPAGNVYDYTGGTTSDTALHAPENPSNGKYYGLSHISFCYVPVVPDQVVLEKTGIGDAALAGAGFDLYRSDDAAFSADDDELVGSDTTDADGIATWEITESGYYFAVETDAPVGYNLLADPVELGFIAVDDAVEDTHEFGPVENAPTPGRVDIEKLNDADDPVAGAEFTLYEDVNDSGTIDAEDVTVGSCTTGPSGACSITNVELGDDYLLDETVMPANHAAGTVSVDGVEQTGWPVAITIGLVEGGDGVQVEAVNERLFTKIVLVCFGNELYQADVTENGETKYTIVEPPAVVDEAVLCGTGGARFEGNRAGDHTLTVGIR